MRDRRGDIEGLQNARLCLVTILNPLTDAIPKKRCIMHHAGLEAVGCYFAQPRPLAQPTLHSHAQS
jgi:hypothetical protein